MLVVALAIAALLFVVYLLVRAYKPSWFEGFGANTKAVPSVLPPKVEAPLAGAETPAVAPPILAEPPVEPERTVSPGGPNTPNARPPPMAPRISPDAVPLDPYDSKNSEAPIEDTLRHPELSFGPGADNDRIALSKGAGTASEMTMSAMTTFSPEFAQNGGSFMGSTFANDLTTEVFGTA